MHYVFDFSAIFQGEYPAWLLRGLVTTLALAGLAWILAFLVGSLLAVIRLTGSPVANALIALYVEIGRAHV